MKKISLKNKIVSGIAGTLGLVVASTPSFAQERTLESNIRVQPQQTVVRTNGSVPNIGLGMDLTFGGYKKDIKNGSEENGGYLLFSAPLDSTKTIGYWLRGVKGETTKNQTGVDITFTNGTNTHYFCPIWYTTVNDGTKEFLMGAIGTQGLSKDISLDYGLVHNIYEEEKPTDAVYAVIRSDKVGLSIGKDYDDKFRPAAGFNAGNLGGLVYSIHNLETGEHYVKTVLAQNPTKVAGPEGPKTVGDLLTLDSYLPETNPYLSGIAGKSKEGFALEVQRSTQNGSDFTSTELGFNNGNGFGISVGRQFGTDSHYLAKFVYKVKQLFTELRVREGKEPELYVATTGIKF